MSRSTMTARMPRRGALALGTGIAVAALASGCGAGQITQTEVQRAAVPGTSRDAGPVAMRNLTVQYKDSGYAQGDDAPLNVYLYNSGNDPVKLCAARTNSGSGVTRTSGSASPTTSASPTPSASPSATAKPTATTKPTATGKATPSASASATPSAGSADCPLDVTIPPLSNVSLTPDDQQFLQVTSLNKELPAGGIIQVDFTFRLAQGSQVDTGLFDIPVNTPVTVAPRSPLNLTPSEG